MPHSTPADAPTINSFSLDDETGTDITVPVVAAKQFSYMHYSTSGLEVGVHTLRVQAVQVNAKVRLWVDFLEYTGSANDASAPGATTTAALTTSTGR